MYIFTKKEAGGGGGAIYKNIRLICYGKLRQSIKLENKKVEEKAEK